MQTYNRVFTPEFKMDAATSALHGDAPLEDVANVMSVTRELIELWCQQFLDADPELLKVTTDTTAAEAAPVLKWEERKQLAS